jgi:DNA repair protein RadC
LPDVLLKKVDPKLYARLKAEAAAESKSVGAAFNEAVKVWLASKGAKDEERERNVEVYLKIKKRIPQHPNDYFVIAKGTFLGRFHSLSEAFEKLKENQATKALVVHYQPSGEWLGGSLET